MLFSSLCALVFLRFCPLKAPITQCIVAIDKLSVSNVVDVKYILRIPKKTVVRLGQLIVAFFDASSGLSPAVRPLSTESWIRVE